MPSITLTVSAENWPRIVGAADLNMRRLEPDLDADPPEDPETDGHFVRRWITTFIKEQVHRSERRLAADAVLPDDEIVDP